MGNGRTLTRFPHDKKAATMSIKAYKYRIEANKATTEKLQWVLDRARELYNAGLQERRDVYEIMVKPRASNLRESTRSASTSKSAIWWTSKKRSGQSIRRLPHMFSKMSSFAWIRHSRHSSGASRTARSPDTPAFRGAIATTRSAIPTGQAGSSRWKSGRKRARRSFQEGSISVRSVPLRSSCIVRWKAT